ncbi:Ankyrin repeat domain-containing protein 13A [Basidiobolus ranarum]|uniref:Ankyrin repeat domain-containing protein 13A n=1 Tax=Basidiobolus ranarum TaxID=34480 RepID=A0ABR2W0U5_9FUNG
MHLTFPLHRYVFQNDDKAVEAALGGPLYNQINERDHRGNTPLQLALILGRVRIANILLNRGAECLGLKKNGNEPPSWTSLDEACALEDRDLVRKVLQKSIDQHVRDWCAPPVDRLQAATPGPMASEVQANPNIPPEGGPLARLNQGFNENTDLTLHWKFTSRLSNALARHALPRDAVRIRKKSSYFRLDFGETSLGMFGGFDKKDERSADVVNKRRQYLKKHEIQRFSLVIRVDDPNIPQAFPAPPAVFLLDHEREWVQELYPEFYPEALLESAVSTCLRAPMVKYWIPLRNIEIKEKSEKKKKGLSMLMKKKSGSTTYKIKNASVSILIRELEERVCANGGNGIASNALIKKLKALGFSGLESMLGGDGDIPKVSGKGGNGSDSESDSDSEDETSSNVSSNVNGKDHGSKGSPEDPNIQAELVKMSATDSYEEYFSGNIKKNVCFNKAETVTQYIKFELKEPIKVKWAPTIPGSTKSKNLSNGNSGFPISFNQFSPIFEHLFSGGILDWAGFASIWNECRKKDATPGFPVKVNIPLHPVIGVRISFKECHVGMNLSDDLFQDQGYAKNVIIH